MLENENLGEKNPELVKFLDDLIEHISVEIKENPAICTTQNVFNVGINIAVHLILSLVKDEEGYNFMKQQALMAMETFFEINKNRACGIQE